MNSAKSNKFRMALLFSSLAAILIVMVAATTLGLGVTSLKANLPEYQLGPSNLSLPRHSCHVAFSYDAPRGLLSVESAAKASMNRQDGSTGTIVPIFASYSSGQLAEVNEVIREKQIYPSVQILPVLNPANGPGPSYNSGIASEVQSMQNVNLTVLGYVPTDWGARNISSVEQDILSWHTWYHVNGLQLDQTPNWEYTGPQGQWNYSGPAGVYMPSYFSNLTSYGHSLGMSIVYGNSGADVPKNFMGKLDVIGIFENQFLPAFFSTNASIGALTGLDGWHLSFNKGNYSFTSYNVQTFDPYFVAAASDYVGYLYFTNGGWQQPYGALASYFPQLIGTLASLAPINIEAETINGAPIAGMQTSVSQPNGMQSIGFTPFSFNAISNTSVSVTAYDYGGYVFSHWSDGSSNSTIRLTISRATSLVAYYLRIPPEGCPLRFRA